MRLYVGNIPFSTTAQDLKDTFSAHGPVFDANVVLDRETQRPRGFGFVDMDDEGARKAIEELHGANYGGRAIVVNEAKDRARRDRGQQRRGGRDARERNW